MVYLSSSPAAPVRFYRGLYPLEIVFDLVTLDSSGHCFRLFLAEEWITLCVYCGRTFLYIRNIFEKPVFLCLDPTASFDSRGRRC